MKQRENFTSWDYCETTALTDWWIPKEKSDQPPVFYKNSLQQDNMSFQLRTVPFSAKGIKKPPVPSVHRMNEDKPKQGYWAAKQTQRQIKFKCSTFLNNKTRMEDGIRRVTCLRQHLRTGPGSWFQWSHHQDSESDVSRIFLWSLVHSEAKAKARKGKATARTLNEAEQGLQQQEFPITWVLIPGLYWDWCNLTLHLLGTWIFSGDLEEEGLLAGEKQLEGCGG